VREVGQVTHPIVDWKRKRDQEDAIVCLLIALCIIVLGVLNLVRIWT
jgi:hypothetical protein